jgi:hypothetical protein
VTEEPEMVQVRSCQGWDLAQIYKSNLEAHGIPVLLRYESAGLLFGITVDGLGQVRIMVPAEFAEEAEAVLEDIADLTGEDLEDEEEEEEEEETASGEEDPA